MLVFNRPETTFQVFEEVRRARPARLYVASDGPRPNRAQEAGLVERTRGIVDAVDWPCCVRTLFRDENLGCRNAVSGALDWFFEQEEEGIILEDDCLPSQSFFGFCDVLLERYRDNTRVFNITGFNKQQRWKPVKHDYFFSSAGGIWGWATWRRAWRCYDPEMNELESWSETQYLQQKLGKTLGKLRQRQLERAAENIRNGKISSWAFPWAYTRLKHDAFACVPSRSLVENIGFGAGATHTLKGPDERIVREELTIPFRMNDRLEADIAYDLRFLGHRSIRQRIGRRLARVMPGR